MNAIREAEAPSREQALHALYEAAELEHNLMCTYLYAAFSLRDGEAEGLSAAEAAAVARWRRDDHRRCDRGDGAPGRGLEHHVRARRLAALRPRQLPARSRRLARERRREARAVRRRGAAALHLSSSDPTARPSPTAKVSRPNSCSGAAAPNRLTPMGLDYETVGHVLRHARPAPARVRRASTVRQTRSAAIRRYSCRRRRSSSRARNP